MSDAAAARVLVRPPNWLGDAVLALPAIAAIRRHFHGADLAIAAPAAIAALFRQETDARPDRVIEMPADARSQLAALRGEGATIGVLFPNSFGSALQLRRAGVVQRWGYATSGRGLLLTHKSRPPKPRRSRHQSDYYKDLVRGLGIECEDADRPRLAPSGPSAARAEALLMQHKVDLTAPIVGFAPGAAYGQAKQWPPDRVAQVAASLVRARGVTCVLVGASHDRDAARAIESWLRANAADVLPRVISLVGHTSLGALVGVIARSAVFVSNDSGAMHVAAAIGRPVVAIFGPTDERATSPIGDHVVITEDVFCRPCMLRDCPIDHRCMKRITADDVAAAVNARLDAPVVA